MECGDHGRQPEAKRARERALFLVPQRLQTYIVTSKPKRMSEKLGLVHIVVSSR